MDNNSTSLTIISTAIRQDAEGRYCLNDCHKASGGSANKRPGEWLRNEQTQSLIRELTDAGISASPVSSIKGGPEQGTYVAKELVYAYAMWINPAFHLAVIRAFDSIMSGEVPRPQIPNTLSEALRLAADQAEQIEQQSKLLEVTQPKADALDLISEHGSDMGVVDAGREIKKGMKWVVDYILEHHWACRKVRQLRPAHYGLTMGYCRLVARSYVDKETQEVRVADEFRLTRKGVDRLAEIAAAEKKKEEWAKATHRPFTQAVENVL